MAGMLLCGQRRWSCSLVLKKTHTHTPERRWLIASGWVSGRNGRGFYSIYKPFLEYLLNHGRGSQGGGCERLAAEWPIVIEAIIMNSILTIVSYSERWYYFPCINYSWIDGIGRVLLLMISVGGWGVHERKGKFKPKEWPNFSYSGGAKRIVQRLFPSCDKRRRRKVLW